MRCSKACHPPHPSGLALSSNCSQGLARVSVSYRESGSSRQNPADPPSPRDFGAVGRSKDRCVFRPAWDRRGWGLSGLFAAAVSAERAIPADTRPPRPATAGLRASAARCRLRSYCRPATRGFVTSMVSRSASVSLGRPARLTIRPLASRTTENGTSVHRLRSGRSGVILFGSVPSPLETASQTVPAGHLPRRVRPVDQQRTRLLHPGFPILGVFRLKGQPEQDNAISPT